MYKISYEVIKFIEKTIKTLRVELSAGLKSLVEFKIQLNLPRRGTIKITICYSGDPTQPHILEMQRQIQTYQIVGKDQWKIYNYL